MKDFRFRGKNCFLLVAEMFDSVVQSAFYEYSGSFPDENFFAESLMSYTFSDIDQLTYGFQGKISPGFSELISTWQRDCIDENYLFWSKQVFNLKIFLRLWQKPSLFGRKSFGSIVKTALSNSRQIFDESIFLENSSIFSKFLILMKNNRRHLTQKFYRQGSQNWNLRVQTIILIESFKRKTPLSISEFQRKLFVLLEGKLLQLSQNFSVYVQ